MSVCKACEDPLVFRPDPEEDDEEVGEVPDDLQLPCGCHFHWQCLLDEASQIAISLKCPSCDRFLPSNPAGPSTTNPFSHVQTSSIIAKYISEGGVEPELDILPTITEEAYLESNPQARPARAFHVMCSEGDVEGIAELLAGLDQDPEAIVDVPTILRYQDPLGGEKSGLHLAIEKQQVEVALLLLWLCSGVPTESFPPEARQIAEGNNIGRIPVDPSSDIRALKDGNGATAARLAQDAQGPWTPFLESGLLPI